MSMPSSRMLIITLFPALPLKSHSTLRVKGENQNQPKCGVLLGPHIPLWPTVTPLLQHMVLTAATHYQQMKNDSSSDATPWAHGAESDSENRPFDQSENEMELLNASDETIPLFPNQLVKLGHRIKEKQLERPKSDKTLDEGCYASGMASFFGFPGTIWIEWPQGSRKWVSHSSS